MKTDFIDWDKLVRLGRDVVARQSPCEEIQILTDRKTASLFKQYYARATYYYYHHLRRKRAWLLKKRRMFEESLKPPPATARPLWD